jgi:hypothetical protein
LDAGPRGALMLARLIGDTALVAAAGLFAAIIARAFR